MNSVFAVTLMYIIQVNFFGSGLSWFYIFIRVNLG